ncbi:protein of unknown function [Cyclobacterium lianum]|uniref:6-bladed beta-propeller protein n=1 Tax=Cyclobacterium lianum TaxID=388280 RepID=A0A1M7Q4L0_9BACT|nr:DUF4221 family protein [Cyclobacterium lianum]SHN25258.1 protein of unknown function [Cyclobacterium lianum]
MINRTFLAIILIISFSCGKSQDSASVESIVYSVDTVIIDSKDRLLDLKRGIWNSDLNDDESAIFLYNGFDHSIDEVKLDHFKITNNYPLETEGPNGTGEHVNYINFLNDSLIFIKSFGRSGVFAKNGDLVERIDWGNAIDSSGMDYSGTPQNEIASNFRDLKVFGLYYDRKNKNVFLDVLSVGENSIKRYDIDSEKSYHHFVLTVDDPKDYTYLDPIVYMSFENDFVLVSHQFSNELYLFNLIGEFIKMVNYKPEMTPERARDLSQCY